MLRDELLALVVQGRTIRIGANGAGWMGSGFVAAVTHVPGMQVSVLSDPDLASAHHAFRAAGVPDEKIVEAETIGAATDALRRGQRVVTCDATLAARLDAIDIVTDVTPSPASGAEVALAGIANGKDVVLINIEADVTVGRILAQRARRNGVLYSVSSGDEPGCLMELYDFVTTLGYEPIVIGKGKNNPLDTSATPDTVAESARLAGKDPFQVETYVDGTKTMFEMACAANATGCAPTQRGMIGPEADLKTISRIFALAEDGGLARFAGAVDFVQGSAMSGGVFATVRVDDSRLCADLAYLKVGTGKYYTFFRPYHLWFLEAPISFARAHLHRHITLAPLEQPVADLMTVTKRALQPGDCLDEFGGYTFYGVIDSAAEVRRLNALPVGLAPGVCIRRPLAPGQIVTWEDVALNEESDLVKLRREQDAAI